MTKEISVLDSETRIRAVFQVPEFGKNEDLCSSRPECQSSSLKVVLGRGGGVIIQDESTEPPLVYIPPSV